MSVNRLDKYRNLKVPIIIAAIFIFAVCAIIISVFYFSYTITDSLPMSNEYAIQFNDSIIQLGNFTILSMTLIALILYTLFTYVLAIKKEDAIVTATIRYIAETRDVRVILNNPTLRYARARVWLNAKANNKTIDLGPAYSGLMVWDLTPQFMIDGHFLLEEALKKVDTSFDEMKSKANEYNIMNQLQLSLKIEWQDEEGIPGRSPEHNWYFDFRTDRLVYKVGGFSNMNSS